MGLLVWRLQQAGQHDRVLPHAVPRIHDDQIAALDSTRHFHSSAIVAANLHNLQVNSFRLVAILASFNTLALLVLKVLQHGDHRALGAKEQRLARHKQRWLLAWRFELHLCIHARQKADLAVDNLHFGQKRSGCGIDCTGSAHDLALDTASNLMHEDGRIGIARNRRCVFLRHADENSEPIDLGDAE